MSRDILSGVIFTPASRTLDFSGIAGFEPRRLRTVIHQGSNTPLFLLGGGKAVGGTWAANVLTLAADTTAMAAGDPLTISISDERARFFIEATNLAVASNAQFVAPLRDAGDSTLFNKINAAVFSSQAGAMQIYQSQDVNAGTQFITDSVPVAAGGFARLSVPLCCRYARVVFSNQATAGTISLSSALTA